MTYYSIQMMWKYLTDLHHRFPCESGVKYFKNRFIVAKVILLYCKTATVHIGGTITGGIFNLLHSSVATHFRLNEVFQCKYNASSGILWQKGFANKFTLAKIMMEHQCPLM